MEALPDRKEKKPAKDDQGKGKAGSFTCRLRKALRYKIVSHNPNNI
jgi:hypothetical protein